MPAFSHSQVVDLFWNGFDVTRAFRKVDAERTQKTEDVTCFGDAARRIQVGLKDGKLSAEGIFDNAAVGTPDSDTQLRLALDAVEPPICFCPEGAAINNPVELIAGAETGYSIESPVDGITAVKAEAMASHGLERCLSLHDMVSENAGTVNSASVDNGASSALGCVGVIQVTSVTAGSAAIKIQHSTDNSVWVDLITFTSVAAAGAPAAQRIVVAGTVNRYLRAQAVVTTGPATYHVAAGRKPQNG